MNFRLDWMFLANPADLRDRLLHTAFHAHSFPPGQLPHARLHLLSIVALGPGG